MNLLNAALIPLAALVAGAALLVYADKDAGKFARGEFAGAALAASDQGQVEGPLYDFNALPEPVKRMLGQIAEAAQSGEIENMRTVLESNELKPMVTTAYVEDPIAFWKKQSADGAGRDVLAAMLDVMSSGFIRTGKGQDEMYVWPYFAETDLAKLTPAQEVEFYRVVAPALAVPMKRSGKYSYYRLGISPSGVLHYLVL
jgi:hypothetical protein